VALVSPRIRRSGKLINDKNHMIISKLFIIHEADPKTYTRLVCRIFGGHTSSSLLWSADGDDFVVVIPLSDDWSAQLQAEFQQAQPMGSRLEIAGLRYDLQPSGGICRINRNGCKATVRNEDLVKGTPIILRDGDKTFEVPREHSSLMHAVITGCAFSQTAPDFSGRIQLSNYSSLDTSQFCALLDYFRGKDITEIGGGCGHFAWTMLALGAKSVTSYDENPPEAFPPVHPRITQQLKELGWEFIQKDLGHGLTPEVTEHLVVAWPTPPDDTTYTRPIAWEKILPFAREVFYLGRNGQDNCGTPKFWALLASREILEVDSGRESSIMHYGPGFRPAGNNILWEEVSGFVVGQIPYKSANVMVCNGFQAEFREMIDAWSAKFPGKFPSGKGKRYKTKKLKTKS